MSLAFLFYIFTYQSMYQERSRTRRRFGQQSEYDFEDRFDDFEMYDEYDYYQQDEEGDMDDDTDGPFGQTYEDEDQQVNKLLGYHLEDSEEQSDNDSQNMSQYQRQLSQQYLENFDQNQEDEDNQSDIFSFYSQDFDPLSYAKQAFKIYTPQIQYHLDNVAIRQAYFGTLFSGQEVGRPAKSWIIGQETNKELFAGGVLRIKSDQIGGTIQLLFKHQYPRGGEIKQMKIQIRSSQINNLISFTSDRILCISLSQAPQFFINVWKDQRPFPRRGNQNYGNTLTSGPKRYERVQNILIKESHEADCLKKYMMLKRGAIFISTSSYHFQITNAINKFRVINLVQESSAISTISIPSADLYAKFSMSDVFDTFEKYEDQYKFQIFEIKFSLLSILYQCDLVRIQQIKQLVNEIKICLSQAVNQMIFLEKAKDILIGFNKEKLHLKLQRGVNLVKQFKKRIAKKQKKQKKEPNDNLHVKSMKMTPSGLVPAGWNIDIRNRLSRNFPNNDFQFMRVQVTNDDSDRSKLFQGGQILRKIIFKTLKTINLFGFTFVPLGWTQSQLKESSLWYTYEPPRFEQINVKVIRRPELLKFLGQFDHIKNPALKAARIGQNLAAGKSILLQNVNFKVSKDDQIGRYLFTDGIGKISPDLVKKVQQKLQIQGTALQIRYLGCKGVLIVNHQLPQNTIEVRDSMLKFKCLDQQAKSYLDILDYNYYKTGYLNRQILILLQANGVCSNSIKQVQKQYIKYIFQQGTKFKDIFENDDEEFEISNNFKEKNFNELNNERPKVDNIAEILQKINMQSKISVANEPTLKGILSEKYIERLERLVKKSHIRVEKSARILGVIDDYGILEQNQIYCTIFKNNDAGALKTTGMKKKMKKLFKKLQNIEIQQQIQQVKDGNIIGQIYQAIQKTEQKKQKVKIISKKKLSKEERKLLRKLQNQAKKMTKTNISGKVMITRNPCMHPADIRVVNCVSRAQAQKRFKQKFGSECKNYFEQLANCVIFPKKGKVPLTAEISGSDLDGDTFFITWDPRLIPRQCKSHYICDDDRKQQRMSFGSSYDDMMDFFCQFIFNNNLGRLANAHLAFADVLGADSYNCIELCKIHSKAVDYPKKGFRFDFPKTLWVKQFPHYMQKGKQKKSFISKSILGDLYNQALGSYNYFLQKSAQLKCNIANRLKFFFTIRFSNEQIRQACYVVSSYSKQISSLMKVYKMKREFQIFVFRISKRNRESKNRMMFIQQLKLKYFMVFFDGLEKDISDSPFKYLAELKKNQKSMNKDVYKRLALWYLVSCIELIKVDKREKNQVELIESIRRELRGQSIKNIGLCWFCLPFMTFKLLSSAQKAQEQARKQHERR